MPHEAEQCLNMKSTLRVHSPASAHAGHELSMSRQVCVHAAHECGQSFLMWSPFSHSPFLAQLAHDSSESLQ